MARLSDAGEDGDVADRIRARRGGELEPLDRMLLHSPPIADGWNELFRAIRERTTLPADVRELAILRVAVLNRAEYEWAGHEPVARAAGLGDAELSAVRDARPRQGAGALSEIQRAVIAYADAMTREIAVADERFTALRQHFDDRQLVELTATIAGYNLVSRFLVALEISDEARSMS